MHLTMCDVGIVCFQYIREILVGSPCEHIQNRSVSMGGLSVTKSKAYLWASGTFKVTHTHTYRQTHTHTYTHTYRQTDRHRHTHSYVQTYTYVDERIPIHIS